MLRQTRAFCGAFRAFALNPSRSSRLTNAPRFPHKANSQTTSPLQQHTTLLENPYLHPSLNPARQFTSTHYQRANQYNRFNSSSRQTVFVRLLQTAKPRHFVFLGLGISGLYLYNTEEVEMTGRRRFNCVSRAQELKMGTESYRDILNSERGKVLPENHPLTKMVDGVLQRLIPGVGVEGADWRVHVIKDDGVVNAFVLPG
jgi:hypothetical protein